MKYKKTKPIMIEIDKDTILFPAPEKEPRKLLPQQTPLLSEREAKLVLLFYKWSPFCQQQVAEMVSEALGQEISQWTVSRWIRQDKRNRKARKVEL